jgi:hypothetical protein
MAPWQHRALSNVGDSVELAQLAANLAQTRAAIDLWQYAVLRIPAAARDVSIASDTKLLDGVLASAVGWLELLQLRAAEGDDKRLVAAFTHEIGQCAEWAEEARLALRLIAAIPTVDRRSCRLDAHQASAHDRRLSRFATSTQSRVTVPKPAVKQLLVNRHDEQH